jgi:hypothetical protein
MSLRLFAIILAGLVFIAGVFTLGGVAMERIMLKRQVRQAVAVAVSDSVVIPVWEFDEHYNRRLAGTLVVKDVIYSHDDPRLWHYTTRWCPLPDEPVKQDAVTHWTPVDRFKINDWSER